METMKCDESLPVYAGYTNLLTARSKELKVISQMLESCKHGSRAYQKMPRHMQRRQVSSHPKRLPRSIRHKNRMEIGDLIKDRKRPSRKYRRRPSNLLQEYAHRQEKTAWLETHIWHAKRFHMIKQWDYSIPFSPTANGYRSTFRAIRESCLAQDTSYDTCLQVDGNRKKLLYGIGQLLSAEDLEILSQNESLQLEEWHEVMLYQPNKYPFGAIGGIRFYWHPVDSKDESHSLWMWVHTSILREVIFAIVSIFDMSPTKKVENSIRTSENIDELKLVEVTKLPSVCSLSYESNGGISLHNLKGCLNKFSLFGPQAVNILCNVLQPINLKSTEPLELGGDENEKSLFWWKSFFTNVDNLAANQYQLKCWNNTQMNLPNKRTVFGFVARDVRFTLPAKKITFEQLKCFYTNGEVKDTVKVVHPILNREIRENVSNSMASNDAINKIRSSQLIPGSDISVTEWESRMPVLILFNPGSRKNPSWDVILPRKWAQVTWVSLHYHGAVAGGLQQEISLFKELLISSKPYMHPDSLAGKNYRSLDEIKFENEHWKRPPKSRPNYLCFGTQHPFHSPWTRLVNSWSNGSNDYYVLRDRQKLDSYFCYKISKKNKKRKLNSGMPCPPDPLTFKDDGCLIEVRLIVLKKGTIAPFAMICLPTPEDLKDVVQNYKESTWSNLIDVLEPIHKDENVAARKELKEEHKKIKLKLQRCRRRVKELEKESLPEEVANLKNKNKEASDKMEAYENDMKKLWLVDKTSEIQMCSRKIMGYVEWGDFSILNGRYCGRGFVVSNALADLYTHRTAEFNQLFVLIRNASNLNYLWARLEII